MYEYIPTLRFKNPCVREHILNARIMLCGGGATAHDCACKNHLIRHQTVLNSVTDEKLCSFYSTGRAFGRQIRAHLLQQPAAPYLDCVPTRIAHQWTTIDVQYKVHRILSDPLLLPIWRPCTSINDLRSTIGPSTCFSPIFSSICRNQKSVHLYSLRSTKDAVFGGPNKLYWTGMS
jgi:hypothetical protein